MSHRPASQSLQKRFAKGMVSVVLVLFVAFLSVFLFFSYRSLDNTLQERLAKAADLAKKSLTGAVWEYSHGYVEDFVDSLFLNEEMVFVRVHGNNRLIRLRADPRYQGWRFKDFEKSGQFLTRQESIVKDSGEIGIVQLVMSRELISRSILKNAVLFGILGVMITTALIFMILLIFRRYILLPLLALERSTRRIGEGSLDIAIDIDSEDEIGNLGRSFVKMVENLKTLTISRDELDHEVRERIKTEERLREERDRSQNYLNIAGVILLILDHRGIVRLINAMGCRILGYPEDEIVGRNWLASFIDSTKVSEVRTVLGHMSEEQAEPVEYHENEVITRSGERCLIAWRNIVLRDKNGTITGTLSSGEDVTERRRMENKLKSSLEEKEVLLKEIHHRVKNNLQMIQSLLSLQHENGEHLSMESPIRESMNRIQSIALIHETLYQSSNLSSLDLTAYFRELVDNLLSIYYDHCRNLEVVFDVEPVELDINTSIYCGLILNELVTNALKYAYDPGRQGRLTISLAKTTAHQLELCVRDNGRGLEMPGNIEDATTLGLRIVRMLAIDQLQGELSFEEKNGLSVTIRFPSS